MAALVMRGNEGKVTTVLVNRENDYSFDYFLFIAEKCND